MRRWAVAVVMTTCSVTAAGAIPVPEPARALTVIHVSPAGSDRSPGTPSAPVRTLGRAVAIAPSGSSVVLHAGTYHESVQIYAKDLDIAAAPGEYVEFDGARPVTGWRREATGWSASWSTSYPRTSGEEMVGAPAMAAYPDLAFLNGAALRQVASVGSLTTGTFFVDTGARRLWVADDPTGQLIEASDLAWALYFNRAHGSSLRGVTIERYATPARDMAAVRLYGNSIYMADCIVTRNAYKGVSVIGSDVRLERLTVRNNAYIGVHGHASQRVIVVRSTIVGNNQERFNAVHSGSGVKFTTSTVVSVRGSYVADNKGVGIWTDLGTSYVTIVGNLVERNAYSGILMELSGQVVVADNVVLDSGEAGIWILETNDADVYHNATYRNVREIWVEEGPRTDVAAGALVNWDLNRIRLRNNVVGHDRGDEEALVNVDDWTERRSFVAMGVTSDSNLFWLPAGATTTKLNRWARWPDRLAVTGTLEAHRAVTGQDLSSRASTASVNPWARSLATYDTRVPTGLPLGVGLPRRVAQALGLATGYQLPIGPRRWMAPPTTGVGVRFRS